VLQFSRLKTDGSTTDEAAYLDCQNYTGQQCEDGNIAIGQFYDKDCTMNANKPNDSDTNSGYTTFQYIHDM
jgi:hypothetical protein